MTEFLKKHKWQILLCIYAIILVIPHFLRIFDNYFWGDEAYTILLAKMNVFDMFRETAADVHPPLYYILVKLFCTVFGFKGWTYHLVSFLAYLGVIAISVTYIERKFGFITSFLLISCASLLPNTFTYNVEVRMYSFGALFVLTSFLFLQRILEEHKTKDYIFFTAACVAAAYTHYYCLVMISFFYLFLIVYSIVKRKEYGLKTLISSVAAIVCYLPWFFVLFTTFKRTSDDFWMMWIPTLRECFEYIFAGKLSLVLFGILLASAVLFVIGNLIFIKKGPRENTKSETNSDTVPKTDIKSFRGNIFWVAAGFLAIFGTMFIGIMVSRIVRPLFITRYLYPVCVIAWFLLGYFISNAKIKGRSILAALVLVVIVISSYSGSLEIIRKDMLENELLKATLSVTSDMQDTDRILTNHQNMDWTLSDYYYPGVSHELVTPEDFPELKENTVYWLIISPESADEFKEIVLSRGFSAECRINNGIIGTSYVDIYKISK